MRKIITILFATASILGLTAVPAAAAPTIGTLVVTQAGFNHIMGTLSSCGTVSSAGGYVAPTATADVAAAIKADVANTGYVAGFGFTRWSGDYLTANGLPMTIFVKNITRTYITPDGGTFTTAGIGHVWHAFVPGLFGRPCTDWVKVEAQDF